MNKESVERRLAQLRVGLEQARADLFVQEGAVRDCEYWLEQLTKEEAGGEPDSQPDGGQETNNRL